MNMYLDKDAADAEVARWKALAQARRERSERYADEMNRLSVPYAVTIVSSVELLVPDVASLIRATLAAPCIAFLPHKTGRMADTYQLARFQ